ncbi:MAG: hypothetical protein V7776_13205 [Halopseudomonas aestusnigri]
MFAEATTFKKHHNTDDVKIPSGVNIQYGQNSCSTILRLARDVASKKSKFIARFIASLATLIFLPFPAAADLSTPEWSCWFSAKEHYKEVSLNEIIADVAPLRQWMFNANTTGTVTPSKANSTPIKHSLKNKARRRFLQYEKQKYGINLGWTDNAAVQTEKDSRGFAATLPNNRKILRYGDVVALSWGQRKPYLRYKKREWGINLVWAHNPSYEWKVLGGRDRAPVQKGKDWVILFNMAHSEPMLYFKRDRGANIGWPDSKHWSAWWKPNFTGTIHASNPCEKYMARAAARVLAEVPVIQ